MIAKGQEVDDHLPKGLKGKRGNIAEAIENNTRKLIIDETPVNPKFYEKMSELLSDLVTLRRNEAIEYAQYLEKIAELLKQIKAGHGGTYPATIRTPGQKAIYDNLGQDEALALRIDQAVRDVAPYGFRENLMKQKKIRLRLEAELGDPALADAILQIVKNHSEY